LKRFAEQQRTAFPRAIAEVKKGRKESCWMWYIVPTAPHIVNGIEKGSPNNRKYALRSDEEVRAYLQFQAGSINLRENYIQIMEATKEQLVLGKTPFGRMDEPKLRSSLKLFSRVVKEDGDQPFLELLTEVMKLLHMSIP